VRVVFRQSGGFAGLLRGSEMEWGELSSEEEEVLMALMGESHKASRRAASPARDLEAYELRVEEEGSSRSVQLDQLSIPEALHPLLERLKERAEPRPLEP
jgi:hypothetical protein